MWSKFQRELDKSVVQPVFGTDAIGATRDNERSLVGPQRVPGAGEVVRSRVELALKRKKNMKKRGQPGQAEQFDTAPAPGRPTRLADAGCAVALAVTMAYGLQKYP